MPASSKRNLHHESDTPQACGAGSDTLRSVLSLATTANTPEWLSNPEWAADMEYIWRTRVRADVDALEARARRRRRQAREPDVTPVQRVTLLRSAEWAEHRARSLALARADVVSACEQRWRSVACGCGRMEFKVGCKQPQLCTRCRKKHWRKWSQRITLAMERALTEERSEWYKTRRGMRPGVYLITLTGPHSGDLETDRRLMGVAVRALFKTANARQWWRTYALTWEATNGTDGRGHMHAHLAVISQWIPYEELHDAWRRAMPDALVLDVQAPRTGSDEAGNAAGYLAKYVTKGVDPRELTGRKAGELLCALRNRRKVTTSRHFWVPPVHRCDRCEQPYRSVGAPVGLQHVVPGAVLRSMAERMGVWIPRGAPQSDLRWDGS